MKKLFIISFVLVLGLAFTALDSQAQWTTSGADIYNTNSGNVGIAHGSVFAPTADLHVYDATSPTTSILETNYNEAGNRLLGYYRIKNVATGDLYNISLRFRTGATELIQSAYNGSTAAWLEFIYLNYTTRKYEMRNGVGEAEFLNTGNVLFNNTGGVGIGVTALGTGVKFQVAGKIKVQEVEVALTPWPDFVFQPDYKLKPLEEVEAFILENNHLPGVPSQQEIETNGLNLGEMDAILMEKVEELTLYMIELKKENALLKERIQELEK